MVNLNCLTYKWGLIVGKFGMKIREVNFMKRNSWYANNVSMHEKLKMFLDENSMHEIVHTPISHKHVWGEKEE